MGTLFLMSFDYPVALLSSVARSLLSIRMPSIVRISPHLMYIISPTNNYLDCILVYFPSRMTLTSLSGVKSSLDFVNSLFFMWFPIEKEITSMAIPISTETPYIQPSVLNSPKMIEIVAAKAKYLSN